MRNLSTTAAFDQEWVSTTDPMSSMGNLMDVMLVFACGLMLALATYWDVGLYTTDETATDETAENDMTQIEGELSEEQAVSQSVENGFSYVGEVYRDPTTGDLYVLETDNE